MNRLRIIRALVLALSVTSWPASAQNSASGKFNDAIKRSQSGADAVARLVELSDQGISKKLIDSAEAIGVFPCRKKDALIEYAVLCPGAISRHLSSGWTAPAFYKFGGGGFGRPTPALAESNTIILLFLDKQSIDWLGKPFKFEDEKEARAGRLGPLTEAELANLKANAQIVAYAIRKDGLKGVMLSGGFERTIAIDQDNHINQSLYGIKGSDLLAGKEVTNKSIAPEIFSFQQALQKYFSR